MRIKALRKHRFATLCKEAATSFHDISILLEQEADELDEKLPSALEID